MVATGGPSGASEQVQVAINGDAESLNSALDGAMAKLSAFKTAALAASSAAAALGAGGIAASIDAAADFDAKMTESLAIMGDVSDAMREDMAGAAREVAKETTFSAEQAAESYFFLASAGMDAAESMEALPKVAEFAQAGMFDMARATDILTDAQSALGKENVRLAELSDMLVAANQNANASVEQFGEALTNKAAPAMRRMGIATEEGVAALSVFADQGLKGRRAGTILARTLTGLTRRARKNEEAFADLGVEVTNADGEMRPLAAIIEDLEGALAGMSTEQRQATLAQLGFNRRAQQGLDLLIGNSEQLAQYEQNLRQSGDAASEVANKQLNTLNAQFQLLKSDLNDIAITIGQVFIPHVSDLLSELSTAAEQFQQFNKRTEGSAAAATMAAAAVGGLVVALGTISAPLTAAVAAVGAFAVAWERDWGNIRDITTRVLTTIKNVTQETLQGVTRFWNRHGDQIAQSVQQLANFIGDIWGRFGDEIVGITKNALNIVITVVQAGTRNIAQLFDLVTDAMAGDWEGVWNSIKSITRTTLNATASIIRSAAGLIRNAIGLVIKAIKQPFIAVYNFLVGSSLIPDLFNSIPQIIRNSVGSIGDAVGAITKTIKNTLPSPSDMVSIGKGIAQGIANGIKSGADAVQNAVDDVIDAATSGDGVNPADEETQEEFAEFVNAPDPSDDSDSPDTSGDMADSVSSQPTPAPGDFADSVRNSIERLNTGGLIDRAGLAMLHEGERVLPASQVSDRGEADLDMDEVVTELRALRRSVERSDGATVREQDVVRGLQRLFDRHGVSL